jgi:hypothetical protein
LWLFTLTRRAWVVLIALSAVVPLLTTGAAFDRIAADREYAAEWDELDATLRDEARVGGPLHVDRTLKTRYGFSFMGSDPSSYPNPCVARFYGVPSIVAPDAH